MKRYLLPLFILLTLLPGCVKEPVRSREDGPHTVRMTLLGDVKPFDAPEGTKAGPALTWTEGDRIYVRASDGRGETKGVAVCQADGSWIFSYDALMDARTVQAECWYFQNANESRFEVSLSYASVIYEDTAATLTFDGEGSVTLSTYLKPKTGRLRFEHADGSQNEISLSGLSWYSAFDLSSFNFSVASHNITSFYVSEDNYFYGFFAPDEPHKLVVKNDILYFGREFGESVLRSGSSGYLTVPTNNSYAGWTVENPENLDAYVPIEFEDLNFKLWLHNNGYDLDYDGEISHLEGRAVTSIQNDRDDSVVSLGGIEWFPNLERLIWTGFETWDDEYQRHGRLMKVDVSQNPKLRELNLRCNKLSSLDLSQNAELRSLVIWGNQFETIDLSGCPKLEYLDAGDNKLTALDLTVLPELTWVYCYTNQLTSLDVSRNTKLLLLNFGSNKVTSLNVSGLDRLEELECGGNPLGTLVLPTLPFLRTLYCEYAQLTSLNVSQCPNINTLSCRGNQLTSLNVSSLTELESLDCFDNQITSLDLSSCRKLRSLTAPANKLTGLDVSMLEQLENLDVYDNQLTTLNLGGISRLVNLNCERNPLTMLDVSAMTRLEYLWASECQLVSLVLGHNTQLRHMGITSNKLSGIDLSGLPSLQILSCWDNLFTSLDLSGNPQLEELSCAQNDFSASGLDLSGNPKLRILYCNDDKLTALDVSANPLLEVLGCYSNQLTSLDVYANTMLWHLNCQNNPGLTTVTIRSGYAPNELYWNGVTEIVYVD